MARITLSGLLSNISGKVNGSVFQRNQGGLSLRNQSGKINSNTYRSNQHKVGMSSVQAGWQGLTDSQRLLWNTYSLFLNKKQKRNPTLSVSGHQLFININTVRWGLADLNAIISPYLLTEPVLAALPTPINVLTVTKDMLALRCELDYVIDDTVDVIIMFMSRPLLPSQMSGHTKMILMRAATGAGTEFECGAEYIRVYGRLPEPNEWIQTKIALYKTTSQNYSSYSVQRIQVA